MTKRPNNYLQERMVLTFDHPQVTATTTWKAWKCPAGRSFVIDRVSYINPTGLAVSETDHFLGEVRKGATVMATLFNTKTTGGAALAADTFVEGVASATAANTWLAADDVLSLVATETGIATLPAGRLVIEGRLL